MFNAPTQPGADPSSYLARKVLADTALNSGVPSQRAAMTLVQIYMGMLLDGKHEALTEIMRDNGHLGPDETLKEILPPPVKF